MRGGVAVAGAAFAALLLVAPCARATDDLSLYFTLDVTSARVLEPGAPSGANVREDATTASQDETVTFGPFVTEAAADASRLGIGPVAFSLFLATGASGMPDCAEVVIALTKEPASGPPTPLAARHFTTSLVPKASLVDPIAGLAPMNGAKAARSLAVGDRLAFTVAVTNRCTDGAHSVRLLYDASTRPSRIAFTDDCPTVDDPDQTDTDDDGLGDACDVCPDVADSAQVDRERRGSATCATTVRRPRIPISRMRTATASAPRAMRVPTWPARAAKRPMPAPTRIATTTTRARPTRARTTSAAAMIGWKTCRSSNAACSSCATSCRPHRTSTRR